MCFSSTPVPPTAARIFVLSNSDSVVQNVSGSRSPCQVSNSSVCRVGKGGTPLGERAYPTGGRCVPHWGTVCTPLGEEVCTPLGDGVYPTGGRCVPHWGKVCTPPGHGACPTGVRWVSHRGTLRAKLFCSRGLPRPRLCFQSSVPQIRVRSRRRRRCFLHLTGNRGLTFLDGLECVGVGEVETGVHHLLPEARFV